MKHTLRLLLPLLVLFACKRDASSADKNALNRDKFIQVYTELRKAQGKSQSDAEFQNQKRQILQKAGVSDQQMQQFVKANVDDVKLLADVFDTISNRLSQPDTVAKH